MSTTQAALDLCDKLTAAGIRATTDVTALNPPCVLVPPPTRRYDVGCGFTIEWALEAIAPAVTGGDRVTWAELDALIDAVAGVVPLELARPRAYVPPGGSALPSYLLTFTSPGGD